MLDNSPIDEIKSRLDIVEVVGQYLKLKKTGANLSALCPFHSEKSGSFFVSPSRQTWRCFGCNKGGDMFTFVQEIEGVEFGDALRILAARAGVELKRPNRQTIEEKSQRQRLYDLCELATRFFEKQLAQSKIGLEAKKYLLDRGLTEDSVAMWRLGWAPDSWQALHDFLAREGYGDSEILAAGLAGTSSGGRIYDRFRGRIMFPIFDFNSQAVGFGGRVFGEKKDSQGLGEVKPASVQGYGEVKEAKYLNTTNTLLYDKSRILYGLDKAKVAARRQNACVLVEGYTDVIMSFQAGVENVAASSGTALTETQLKVLKRFTDNLILGYDMDLAGDTANRRGIDLARAAGFNVSVARPAVEDMDPADVIAKDPEIWRQAVAKAQSIMDFYFDRAFFAHDKNAPAGRKKIAETLLPAIKTIPNAVEQAFWLQKIADRMEARDLRFEEYLRQELKKVNITQYAPELTSGSKVGKSEEKSRQDLLEDRFLILALKFPKIIGSADKAVLEQFSKSGQEIAAAIGNGDPKSLAGDHFDALFIKSESETIDEKSAVAEAEFCLCQMKERVLKDRLNGLANDLILAEKNNDRQAADRLRAEYNSLSKSI